jgi:hypothetical protein
MIDKEWAVINQSFIKWLDPSNFDSDGVQKVRLGDIRTRIKSYIEGKYHQIYRYTIGNKTWKLHNRGGGTHVKKF